MCYGSFLGKMGMGFGLVCAGDRDQKSGLRRGEMGLNGEIEIEFSPEEGLRCRWIWVRDWVVLSGEM